MNFLTAFENRFIGGFIDSVPGVGRVVVQYLQRFLNVYLAAGIAGAIVRRGGFKERVRLGGLANVGIRLFGDLAGLAGAPGAVAKSYLSDYLLAGGGTAMRPWSGMSDYLLADGLTPSLGAAPSSPGLDPYGDAALIYGS